MSAEKCFLFTGIASAPKRKLIRKIKDLGGRAISVQDLQPDEEFILICGQLKWTEKFITACCAGLWILHSDFVEKSYASGKWLRESPFEWNTRKSHLLGSGFDEKHLLESPQRWRLHIASGGRKAFHGWNVIIMIKDKMDQEVFTRILTFGGALVFRKRDNLSIDVWKSITHFFIDEDFCLHHSDLVKDLINQGYQCLNPNYIRDYVAQLEPPNVEAYYAVSPELFRTAPALPKSQPAGLPLKGSAEKCTEPGKIRKKPDAQCQTRRGTRDERAKEALRASVRALMPSTLVNRQQREQLLKLEAVVVVEGIQKNPRYANSKDRRSVPSIKRLEVKSSLVKCSTGRRERKTQVDDCGELQSNVVFENISPKKTFGASSENSCTKDFRATDLRKRKIKDDVGLGCKEKKITRLLSNLSNESQPCESDKRILVRHPVLKVPMEINCVRAAQRKEETRLSKKPVDPLSSRAPLSHGQLLFLKQVVSKMTSPVRELQVDSSVQNENDKGSTESDRNWKESDDLWTSSLNPTSSVVGSRVSLTIRRLSEEISEPNQVGLLSSTANKFSPLKQNGVMQTEVDKVADQQCYRKEHNSILSSALSPSDSDDNLHAKQSPLTSITELLNRKLLKTEELDCSVAVNSNQTDLISSSILPPECSTSDCVKHLTSTQPTLDHLQCMTLNPLKAKISVKDCSLSYQLVNTEAKHNDSDKCPVVKDETKDWIRKEKSLPAQKHQFSKTVVMLIDACLNADEGTRFSGRDSVKKLLDAISSFVTRVSYPPSATLTILLKILIEEHGLDERLMHEISTVLERILWLHQPISASMKQVYVDALSHVSIQHQNWQLIEHLFRRVFECSDDSCASNADLLFLHFIIRLVELDFMESKKRLLSAGSGKGRSVRWCLLTQWIWTNEFAAVRSTQFVQLVAVLIAAIRLKNHSDQAVVIGLAQKLVAMGAEAWLLSSVVSLETSIVPRDSWMLALVIAEQLADERIRSEDLKVFLETSECDWMAMVVCRTLLDRMNPDGVVENSSLDLRTIVKYFHLRPYEAESEEVDPRAKCERLTPSKASLMSPKPLAKRSQKPKDVNKTNAKGETQLHVACRKNNLERVRELLQTPGIDVNQADNAGWTPLHEACNRGNIDVVQELLQFKPKRTINSYFTMTGPSQTISRDGVDVRAASHAGGITPLHDAVLNGHLDVCRLLLEHAGVELLAVVDKNGKSAADYARTDEMRHLLLEDHSMRKGTTEGKLDTSKILPTASLSSTQSAVAQNNASLTETTRPLHSQSSSTLRHAISSDCSQRYCILVSNLVQFYVSWRTYRISVDDRVILSELPMHVLRLRQNLLELQNGELLTGQVAALARLEALADLQLITDDQRSENL